MQSSSLLQQQQYVDKNIIVISTLKIHFHRQHWPLGAAGPEAAASLASIMVHHCSSVNASVNWVSRLTYFNI